jgi:hopene-associated glycosyltransferase HpnB
VLAWCALLVGRGGFWRMRPRLGDEGGDEDGDEGGRAARAPRVVAVVPARDEAAMLARSLPSLLGQEGGLLEGVVVVDDASSDGTAEVARRLGAEWRATRPNGPAVTVLRARPTPPGWAGKVWAQAEGVATALRTAPGEPDFLLLTDADIVHYPGTLAALVRRATHDDLDLVSVMAHLRCESRAERLLVPAFVYFFAKLYPFAWVNRHGSRTAAAAGGCMLVRTSALQRVGGMEAVRGERIDDVALARAIKGRGRPEGGRLWLGLSEGVRSDRPYPRGRDVADMVARSAYVQLRYSPALLVGTLAGMALLYLGPLAALAGAARSQRASHLAGGALATALMTASYLPVLRLYRLPPWRAVTLPLAAAAYTAMTIQSAWRHYRRGGVAWKGRLPDRA